MEVTAQQSFWEVGFFSALPFWEDLGGRLLQSVACAGSCYVVLLAYLPGYLLPLLVWWTVHYFLPRRKLRTVLCFLHSEKFRFFMSHVRGPCDSRALCSHFNLVSGFNQLPQRFSHRRLGKCCQAFIQSNAVGVISESVLYLWAFKGKLSWGLGYTLTYHRGTEGQWLWEQNDHLGTSDWQSMIPLLYFSAHL